LAMAERYVDLAFASAIIQEHRPTTKKAVTLEENS